MASPTSPGYPSFGGMNPVDPPRRIRFDAIADAFRLMAQDLVVWVVGFILLAAIAAIPTFLLEFFLLSSLKPQNPPGVFGALKPNSLNLVFALVSPLTAIPTSLIGTALQRFGVLRLRGYQVGIEFIFNLGGRGLVVALWYLMFGYVSSLVFLVATVLGSMGGNLVVSMGLAFGSYLVVGVFSLLLLFVPLLIVDQGQSVGQAVKTSANTLLPHIFPLMGVAFCVLVLADAGLCACGVGFLFTAPSLFAFVSILYHDFFRPIPNPGG